MTKDTNQDPLGMYCYNIYALSGTNSILQLCAINSRVPY